MTQSCRSIRALSGAFILACALTGCASVKQPSVNVEHAALGAMSDEARVLNFGLRLENENPDPLELDEFHYTLRINGETVYTGRRSAEATLSARGGKSITIPAVVPGGAFAPGRAPLAYELSGRLWYRSPGEFADILFDAGIVRPSVSFGTEGTLELAAEE